MEQIVPCATEGCFIYQTVFLKERWYQ